MGAVEDTDILAPNTFGKLSDGWAGASAACTGVPDTGADEGPLPKAFVAFTVNVYATQFESELIVALHVPPGQLALSGAETFPGV